MNELSTVKSQQPEAAQLSQELISKLVLKGDCSYLTPEQKIEYMSYRCNQLGIDLAEGPFEFIKMNGKEVMYAKKACTDALCRVRGITRTVTGKEKVEDVYIVTVKATDSSGRSDEATGAVSITNLKGDALANAIMKAETKAKRRAVLSLYGLGMLDETELETIPRENFSPRSRATKPTVSLSDSVNAFSQFTSLGMEGKPKLTIDELMNGDDIPDFEVRPSAKKDDPNESDKLFFPDFAVNYSEVLSVYNGMSINELEIEDIKKIYESLSSLESKAKKDESKQELNRLKKQTRDALDLLASRKNELAPAA